MCSRFSPGNARYQHKDSRKQKAAEKTIYEHGVFIRIKAEEYQMKLVLALGYHQDLQQVATKDLPLLR